LPPARVNRRFFGWFADNHDLTEGRLRVLGVVGDAVEVEWINRRGRPTAWLALSDPRLARIARLARDRA
jgi:hypothetical protein